MQKPKKRHIVVFLEVFSDKIVSQEEAIQGKKTFFRWRYINFFMFEASFNSLSEILGKECSISLHVSSSRASSLKPSKESEMVSRTW